MTGPAAQRDHTDTYVHVHYSDKPAHAGHINPRKDSCLNDNTCLHKQRLPSADDLVKPDELSHA